MREIKFRAWDTVEKRMYQMHLDGEYAGKFVFGYEKTLYLKNWDVAVFRQKEFIVSQFTGLHDKNGKEIYEGDIVKCQQGCSHEVMWDKEIGGTFGGGMPGWYLKGLIKSGGRGYAWTGEEEIIGNIYESPELLTN